MGVDMEDPYNIYGGLQDHDSWKGPSNGWAGEITLSRLGDGRRGRRHVQLRSIRPTRAGSTTTARWARCGASTRRRASRPHDHAAARPAGQPPCASTGRRPSPSRRTTRPSSTPGPRSSSAPLDRGDHWQEISPDLTTNEDAKQHGEGYISYCTLTTLAESPVEPGVIWTGTDDGKVQVTKDGGATWLDRTAKLAAAGGPADFWVSRVFPSPHAAGHGLRGQDGLAPGRLPAVSSTRRPTTARPGRRSPATCRPASRSTSSSRTARTPTCCSSGPSGASTSRSTAARRWLPFKAGMPSVKVTDLIIHPRENDLVVATYGRGAYVVDVTPLQEMTAAALAEDVHLFDIEPETQRITDALGNYQLLGDSHLFTPNEPNAVVVNYWLKAKAAGAVKITVADASGAVLAELTGKGEAGLNAVSWGHAGPAAGRGRAEARGLGRRAPGRARRVHGDARGGGQDDRQEGGHPLPPGLDRRPDAGRHPSIMGDMIPVSCFMAFWGN
ncbi:MAG: hypothetical protein M0C28_12885 [Candidatus Moduliflexus flocculans]|nr:hypothetical protein [Candidatus Moduliflexus flocculans]